jgi:hypothetical protein
MDEEMVCPVGLLGGDAGWASNGFLSWVLPPGRLVVEAGNPVGVAPRPTAKYRTSSKHKSDLRCFAYHIPADWLQVIMRSKKPARGCLHALIQQVMIQVRYERTGMYRVCTCTSRTDELSPVISNYTFLLRIPTRSYSRRDFRLR